MPYNVAEFTKAYQPGYEVERGRVLANQGMELDIQNAIRQQQLAQEAQQGQQAYFQKQREYRNALADYTKQMQGMPGEKYNELIGTPEDMPVEPQAPAPPENASYGYVKGWEEANALREVQDRQEFTTLYAPQLEYAAKYASESGDATIWQKVTERMVQASNPYAQKMGTSLQGVKPLGGGNYEFSGKLDESILRMAATRAPGDKLGLESLQAYLGKPVDFKLVNGKVALTKEIKDPEAVAANSSGMLRIKDKAMELVKSNPDMYPDVKSAMPAASVMVKEEDDKKKEDEREARDTRKQLMLFELFAKRQDAQDRRFYDRLNLQEFNTTAQPAKSALAKASQFSVLADGIEKKLVSNIDLAKKWIDDYTKKNPAMKNRMGAVINDVLAGKVGGSGELASIRTLFNSINFETAKLESGNFGSGGVTKHSSDAFNALTTTKSAGDTKLQLDRMAEMATRAKAGQDAARDAALVEVNSIRSQYGLPAMGVTAKPTVPQPSAPAKFSDPNSTNPVRRSAAKVVAEMRKVTTQAAQNQLYNFYKGKGWSKADLTQMASEAGWVQ